MVAIASVIHLALVILAVVLEIIVLGVTSDKLAIGTTFCILGKSGNSTRGCDTAIAISVIGMLIGFLLAGPAILELIGKMLDVVNNKMVSVIRAVVCGVVAFLTLVMFAVVVQQYNDNSAARALGGSARRDAQAVSAFSFFALIDWVVLTIFFIIRVLKGSPSAAAAAAPAGPA